MDIKAKWITTQIRTNDVCPEYVRSFRVDQALSSAKLTITALGVYEARCNGARIGKFVLSPGWTAYEKRIQVQIYDITELIQEGENVLSVTVGKGWYASPMPGWINSPDKTMRACRQTGLIAQLTLEYENGIQQIIGTNEDWSCRESRIRFSEIYDGESYNAAMPEGEFTSPVCFNGPSQTLILQEGEEIQELDVVAAKRIFLTPAGETVVDFGQEITGYVEFDVHTQAGKTVSFDHGEVLDNSGNFYRANYRSAKARVTYVCKDGYQTWHPRLTFFGFRYIRLLSWPEEILPCVRQFRAIVVSSDVKRTGSIVTGHKLLNQWVSNVFWGQKGNFLDVPTDCPQRDERLGWTGDAQVFTKAASYNCDVEKFFRKWLHDLAADQRPDGAIGSVIPDYLPNDKPSAAWADAAVIIPWQIWQTYGNDQILRDQFTSMKAWVDYVGTATTKSFLWIGGHHFADWLGLDAPSGSYKGSSRADFIASAFYAYVTGLLIQAGEQIGKDMNTYRILLRNIKAAFLAAFPDCQTQTESVLAIYFGLAKDLQAEADRLAERIRTDGTQMRTGFVGTPYLLHVLSEYGHSDIAWDLLLREDYPSWLYSVKKGATTIWEHIDGIMEDGSFWSADMNSFNHYAFGAAIDWIYEKAAGISHDEEHPGFSEAIITPCPDKRLGFLDVTLMTRSGKIRSYWCYSGDQIRYEIETAMPVTIRIDGAEQRLVPGCYVFWN